MKQKDKILEEYDFNNGARGKYTKAYKERINIVKLDSDVMKFFPIYEEIRKFRFFY